MNNSQFYEHGLWKVPFRLRLASHVLYWPSNLCERYRKEALPPQSRCRLRSEQKWEPVAIRSGKKRIGILVPVWESPTEAARSLRAESNPKSGR
jgi:hypothetical protein